MTGRTAKAISDSLESGVRTAALTSGAVLPSVRALADELGVAPGTVATAYATLRDRGVIETRGRSGTFVSARPPLAARSSAAPVPSDLVDLSGGQPDPRLLPSLGVIRRPAGAATAGAPDAFVRPDFLAQARERLAADGVAVEAVTVTSGGLDGIHRALLAHLRPGDSVAVEDPGWPNGLDLIAALGLRPVPVSVDREGPVAASLAAALRSGASATVITSRAQNPTGAYLTAGRATALRAVLADHRDTVLIEDDHAAELASPALQSLAGVTESWAFARSTSKPYGPDLRVAMVAGDETTIARIEGRLRVSSGWVSTLLQQQVLQLWRSASASAAVARAARTYDERRTALVAALAERGVLAQGDSGLNVWVPVEDETSAVTALMRAGWAVAPGARFRLASAPGVRITVSALTRRTIGVLADDVAAALSSARPAGYST